MIMESHLAIHSVSRWSRSSGLFIVSALVFCVQLACATGPPQTSIFIDQIPLYSSLPECAQDPLSAIVRAQSSGCGDGMQLTSFSCFCVQGSSKFASIISTAVQASCSQDGTRTTRHTTIPTQTSYPGVSSALDVFHSYCERTTELAWYADNSTLTQSSTSIITPPPQTVTVPAATTSASASSHSSKKTNVAAIVVPVIIIPLLIGLGLFFLLRHRRKANQAKPQELYAAQGQDSKYARARDVGQGTHTELPGDLRERQEVQGSGRNEKYAYELQSQDVQRAELDGGLVKPEKSRQEER